jgi:hypothetical protein
MQLCFFFLLTYTQQFIPNILETEKSKIMMPTDSVSGEGPSSAS